ncbi:MAG TPA: DUF5709 domain-containing protein [Propioniciclava tarda]|nr:DUF5709 domain-containing protein [Propioniciclava tarda]HQA30197.1 DUF5709 domain-containing protein [Propioniciclava tarda]
MTEMSDMDAGNGEFVEQLQPDDTLIDRGVDDVLDEGYTTPENWSPLQGYGNTPAEMRQRETIDMRTAQEEPEVVRATGPWNPDGESREVGGRRAGRIVDARVGGEAFGMDVGIDGGAASAEEAAMHIIELDDDDDE